MTTQSLTLSPKLQSYDIDYGNYNYNHSSNSLEHPSYGHGSREIRNNGSNPAPVVSTKSQKSRDHRDRRTNRSDRLSHDDMRRTRTDQRGYSKQKKKKRSMKEQKKWKKKMKEIGKNHPEFELSYDLLLGIRTSTSLVNSSMVRSSMNPADDDSSDDDELSNYYNLYPCTSNL